MSNQSYDDDVFKIGWTREHPYIRAKSLSTSGIMTPFIVEFVVITTEGSKLETQIHHRLHKFRQVKNREFFKITKCDLIEILTTELNLVLLSIEQLRFCSNNPILASKKEMKSVSKLKQLYDTLSQRFDDFTNRFKVEGTEFVVTEVEISSYYGTYQVHICKSEREGNCLRDEYQMDDDELRRCTVGRSTEYRERMEKTLYRVRKIKNGIVKQLFFMQRNIGYAKHYIDNLATNYDRIQKTIGSTRLIEDNRTIEVFISDINKELTQLINRYIWVFPVNLILYNGSE